MTRGFTPHSSGMQQRHGDPTARKDASGYCGAGKRNVRGQGCASETVVGDAE
jgi:hypothetical protein